MCAWVDHRDAHTGSVTNGLSEGSNSLSLQDSAVVVVLFLCFSALYFYFLILGQFVVFCCPSESFCATDLSLTCVFSGRFVAFSPPVIPRQRELLLKSVSGNVAGTHRANHPFEPDSVSYFISLCRAFVCFLPSCFCSCHLPSPLLSISIFFFSVFPAQ